MSIRAVRTNLWLLLFLSLTPLAADPTVFAQTASHAVISKVDDGAQLFDAKAVEKAEKALAAVEKATGVPTFVESVTSLEGETVETAAKTRARRWGKPGIYILIDKAKHSFEMLLSGPALEAVPASRRSTIRDAFLKEFRDKKFDEGLQAGVQALQSALEEARLFGKLPLTSASDGALVSKNQVRLTLEGARKVLAGAEEKATELKLKMNIAVVDDGGHLLAFARMDGARPASGYTAITKATTAATFRQETGPLPKGATQPDVLLNLSLQNAASASGGKVTTLLGGVPVLVDGQVIGGVGVGGGSGEQDAVVAKAGVARFLKELGATQPEAKAEKSTSLTRPSRGISVKRVSFLAEPKQEKEVVPHGQSKPPNPALSPAEAIKRMKVPDGFTVEVVASEPDIVNPVAMTFDDRGRVWITESLEYPRQSPGKGRDRVKVLEDTNGDGKADKFHIFAEGLNIPSGIAVGHGGVWIANSPDILFLQDTDGDGKADRSEVVVTGFGRDDTHELPNTLAWGPDGWLYGWNGVFNPSHVEYRGKTYDFTCAIFRIHPKTREFELYCEGTSNPWGIAWDGEGSAFASACVIDHLWHLTETGYYHRQGGPYPPYTWKIESIVDHFHQKAAYCGIHYYDSDAYPPQYRNKLYFGNIHGNCLNVDSLKRAGSTYRGQEEPDFLNANDSWFMPVSQKTGPDGSIYVLDWYDRYHCYQDANRDPAGIDRLKGRLYRIRYKDTPRKWGFDLAASSEPELIKLLASPTSYERDSARRLLSEKPSDAGNKSLSNLVLSGDADRRTRLNALWALIGRNAVDDSLLTALMGDNDPGFRAWGVRALGNRKKSNSELNARLTALATDPNPDVLLQVAIAARKVEGADALSILTRVAASCGEDELIPKITWRNLAPLIGEGDGARAFLERVDAGTLKDSPGLTALAPHAFERLADRKDATSLPLERLVKSLIEADTGPSNEAAAECFWNLAEAVQSGQSSGDGLKTRFQPLIKSVLDDNEENPLRTAAALLAASWKDPRGFETVRKLASNRKAETDDRLAAINALIAGKDPTVLGLVSRVLTDRQFAEPELRGNLISSLNRVDDPRLATLVLKQYASFNPENQPRVIELLTQRADWGKALLDAIARGDIPKAAVNMKQIRSLQASKDAELTARVKEVWGTIREGRNPAREQVINEVRSLLRKSHGDPGRGQLVFDRVCAQCHKIYGKGQDVGPELTLNGRNSYDQLLSNVLDPSLVIGSAYQATILATTDGRVLTGLLVENSPTRVQLKRQGGAVDSIPADQVDELKTSQLSLMPEDLEKQLKPQELADLFSFLVLDKPPSDPNAKRLPGAVELGSEARGD